MLALRAWDNRGADTPEGTPLLTTGATAAGKRKGTMLGKYLHMADFLGRGRKPLSRDEVQRTTSIGVSVQSLLLDLGTSNTNKLYCSSNSA